MKNNKISNLKRSYNFSVLPFELLKISYRKISNKISTLYWKCAGVRMGEGSVIERNFNTNCPRKIVLGSNCLISKGVTITTEDPFNENIIMIEDKVQINNNVKIDVTGGLKIGRDSLISSNTFIFTHSHGLDPRTLPKPIHLNIGESVWIGERVIILQSVNNIGYKSIVGAGTTLSKDVLQRNIAVSSANRTLIRND